MSELIWLTVPHQLPPVAVWYEDKEKLVEGLHEHEVSEDLKYSEELEDFDKLMDESSTPRPYWTGKAIRCAE